MVCKLATVDAKRFCTAPKVARLEFTEVNAPSIADKAAFAPETVEIFTAEIAETEDTVVAAVVPVDKPALPTAAPPTTIPAALVLLRETVPWLASVLEFVVPLKLAAAAVTVTPATVLGAAPPNKPPPATAPAAFAKPVVSV